MLKKLVGAFESGWVLIWLGQLSRLHGSTDQRPFEPVGSFDMVGSFDSDDQFDAVWSIDPVAPFELVGAFDLVVLLNPDDRDESFLPI